MHFSMQTQTSSGTSYQHRHFAIIAYERPVITTAFCLIKMNMTCNQQKLQINGTMALE